MLSHRVLLSLATLTLFLGQPAAASPITYEFAGTLDHAATNGSSRFSGSFTVNGDPTLQPDGSVSESDVLITIKIGDQAYELSTPDSAPLGYARAQLTVGIAPSWHGDPGQGSRQDEIAVIGTGDMPMGGLLGPYFGMTFYTPADLENLANLRTLNFNLGTGSASFMTPVYSGEASFTSVTLVQTPEPGALAVFALAGVAAFVRLRRR